MDGVRIAIDRGGTFTDVIAFVPGKENYVFKLLSVDPSNYDDANIEGIRRVLEHASGKNIPRGQPLDTSLVRSLKLGTTVATNALLERKGERCALVTTKGFKDALVIGNQTRPHIFELAIRRPDVLYETVVEIDERVTLEDYAEDPEQIYTAVDCNNKDKNLVQGVSGETVRILKRPDFEGIKSTLKILYNTGIRSIGVCLLHSYTFPDHEKIVGDIAKEIGFSHISLSSDISPMIKYVPRANSSIADAYLTPEIKKYLTSFQRGLKDGLQSVVDNKTTGVRCQFMKSDGGMVDSSKFSGLKAILSGPAGGVVGLAETSYNPKNNIPLIGLDVGGTSTDCSRFDGKYAHVFETTTAGITVQSPQLDINTIAAGGGSRLFYENGLMRVGPESAGAHPGPVCYRKNGYLTVTDANLLLGRLVPEFFPKIFGPNENEELDQETTFKEFAKLTELINKESPDKKMTPEEVASGFLNVANEAMARPIRTLTEAKGHVLENHRLVSFGGAGGQCCCFVAFEKLGINTVLIHRYSSVLSAYGMALADVVEEVQEPSSLILNEENKNAINSTFKSLTEKARQALMIQDFSDSDITYEKYLNLRYRGTESAIMTLSDDNIDSYQSNFLDLHKKEFGFVFTDKDIIIDDFRVRAIGKAHTISTPSVDDQIESLKAKNEIKRVSSSSAKFTRKTYFEGKWIPTNVYRLEDLAIGSEILGPAIIADGTQTNVIPPDSVVLILETHVVVTNTKEKVSKSSKIGEGVQIEPVLLSIFGHRFIDIAEQMGNSLQKTAVSTNVKERLDFSCALFDADANLVSSAPHIPVHLGSMGTFVKFQSNLWKGKLKEGDVLVGNHPIAGNTHLPDITVLTPVFHEGKIFFYLASRAHHSDIGSSLPGSMPPNSKELWEEGASIYSEFLVKDGVFQEERMEQLLLVEPAKYPGCSGTRKLSDNISDLKAQVAANQKGIGLVKRLVSEFSLNVVLAYMEAIQVNANNTVQKLLKKIGTKVLEAEDFMDDGSRIALRVDVNGDDGTAVLDFTGTSDEMYGNLNAPEAITYSALIYCLRCIVNESIPLNQGFLRPLKVIIPKGSLLSPSDGAAVVAGNVMTSQRITDVVFKAFKTMAGSQGDCNNFTFGNGGNSENGDYKKGFGYYETIAGGHGAGPTWDGVSAVHTNMTNTKMTDVEVFEKRYPVILREFSIRQNSGGNGKFKGGNGAVRDIEFRVPLTASILSERRVNMPYGLLGGQPGSRGLNSWVRRIYDKDGNFVGTRTINIGGKNTVNVQAGDRIVLKTPGGGGYGSPEEVAKDEEYNKTLNPTFKYVGTGSIAIRHETQYGN
ncbi:hypothetical protein PACTADRAFT_46885 [Pachysolen tannophilus NRRL Y-2460]|uniref:5-oxoprolinase n=1 Tax=Pachysolen tannophilus NRRL Y-2460 TaxID=669874 RepID=A0A1E4TP32_PACTA|nr:hypothetical protein PACTADRAFT_46885 [Pachysolen tannophilus NRRL Y-2460]